jgi:glutathione S-transferase
MIELYHWEPGSNSGEVLILMHEKGIDFVSRYVDVLAFEHHAPAFLELNPLAQVPVLVHDGRVLTETGFILQYLDQVFREPSFTPEDPQGRYWVNVWIKYVEEYLAPAAWRLGAHRTRKDLQARATARVREGFGRIPPERRQAWAKALDEGFSEDDLELARALLPTRLEHMTAALDRHDWLAGEHYSLADIVVFPTLSQLEGLVPAMINPSVSPQIIDWLERMRERPAVRQARAEGRAPDPDAAFAPGPEGSRWG